jgi:murein DD-endopeptidase MepM/ murein hydrolase activator NlpD
MTENTPTGRAKRLPIVRPFFVLAAVWLCWRFLVGRAPDETPAPREEPPRQLVPATEALDRAGNLHSYVVRPGDTFQGILAGFGVSGSEAIRFHGSLSSLGLSTIFPGDSMVLSVGGDGRPTTLSMLAQLKCWYYLYRDRFALTVEKEPIATMRYRCVVKGTLNTSLSEDMYHFGVGDALVAKLADIFAWDINFFIDPRKGDRFEVLFEKYYREGRFVAYGNILAAKYVNAGREMYAIAFDDPDDGLGYYDLDCKSVQKQFLKAPLRFQRVSSGYSYHRRHPVLGIVRPHLGIDYAAPTGTPVYAAADGVVRTAGWNDGYGKFVRIAHGGSYQTCYGHLHQIRPGIRRGVRVKQGELIGRVGATGLATGPHLDYRMRMGARFVNPLTVRLPSKKSVDEDDRARFEEVKRTNLLLLDARFASDGCFVLDMNTLPSPDSALTHISIIAEATPYNASGS